MTEKESLIQEKLKDKEYCDVLSEVRRLVWRRCDTGEETSRVQKRDSQKAVGNHTAGSG